MKTLTDYVQHVQESTEDQVFVVKDAEGNFLNVFNTEAEAKEEVDRWNKEDKANGATISKEKKSEYQK